MTTLGEQYEIRVCVDCAMLIANGEANPEWTEEEHDQHLAAMNKMWPGGEYHLSIGDDEDTFSWSRCDSCDSGLGGTRLQAWAFTINH
jgi:hypothetical protein